MQIGQLARATGCRVVTIRYYERAGILPSPPRDANHYRHYGHAHLRRLRLVRRTRELGFSLDEVRTLLALVDRGDYTCAEVKALTARHLEDVRSRLRDLQSLEQALVRLVDQCSGDVTPDCSLLEELYADAGERGAARGK